MEIATKTANMSSEQLRSYVASGVADIRPEQDLDHVLSRSVELCGGGGGGNWFFCVCVRFINYIQFKPFNPCGWINNGTLVVRCEPLLPCLPFTPGTIIVIIGHSGIWVFFCAPLLYVGCRARAMRCSLLLLAWPKANFCN